jgi:tetratricopeptide (TPR) repeat protein
VSVLNPAGDPYPGLRSFQRDESHIFFGRDSTIHEMVDRLAAHRFLAVTGTSGSGKSSLVRTGLLNALHLELMRQAGAGGWKIVDFRPGGRPLAALAEALVETLGVESPEEERPIVEAKLARSPKGLLAWLDEIDFPADANLLLLVDQFEEMFRFRHGHMGDDIDAFVALLLESARQRGRSIYVVITMRSDFLGDCAQFTGLAETINDGQFLTPRLTREQCQEAIEGPAAVFGGRVERALTNRLLNDMGTNPDQLPLMQHALMLLWENAKKREGSGPPVLTLADYERIGGIGTGAAGAGDSAAVAGSAESALSRHASAVLSMLDANQQRLAEIMFRALTESEGAAGRDVRRQIALGEIADIAGVAWSALVPVVEAFRAPGRNFIRPPVPVVLAPQTTLDITHESLIRQWSKLREWVRAEFQSAETYRHIERTARLWKKGEAGLLTMPFLGVAQAWREREHPNSTWATRYHDSAAGEQNLTEADYEKSNALAKARFDLAMEFLKQSEEEQKRAELARQRDNEEALRREIRAETAERRARNARLAFAAAFAGLAIMAGLSGFAFKEWKAANSNLEGLIAAFGEHLELVRDGYLARNIPEDQLFKFLYITYRGIQPLAARQEKVNAQHLLAQIWDAYSEGFYARGSVTVALKCAEDEYQVADRLTAGGEVKDEWRHDLARSFWRIGEARLALGDLKKSSGKKAATECSVAALGKSDVTESVAGAPTDAWGAFKAFLQQMRALDGGRNAKCAPGDRRLNDQWQRDLSKAYERIGDVLLAQNTLRGEAGALESNLDEAGALEAYQGKRTIAQCNADRYEPLDDKNPLKTYWKWDRVVSHLALAEVQFALGEFEGGDGAFYHSNEARRLSQQLVDIDPSFVRSRWNLGVSLRKIGDVLMKRRDPKQALEKFGNYLDIILSLTKQDPSSRTWQRQEAIARERVGDAKMALGLFDEAKESYAKDHEIADRLSSEVGSNTDLTRDLSISEEKLGDVLMALAMPNEALERYGRYRDLAGKLIVEDADNADWQRDNAISYQRMGEAYRSLGRQAEAANAFKECLRALDQYGKKIRRYDPRNGRPEDVDKDCRKQAKDLANN